MSWASRWHLAFPRFITWSSHLELQGSLETPAQVSVVYSVKNHVHLLLKCHCTNKLLAKLGWGIGKWAAVVGLWDPIFCACGFWSVFSLWCFLGALLSMLHTCLGQRDVTSSYLQACCSPCFWLTAPCSTVHQKWCLVPVVFLTEHISGKWNNGLGHESEQVSAEKVLLLHR